MPNQQLKFHNILGNTKAHTQQEINIPQNSHNLSPEQTHTKIAFLPKLSVSGIACQQISQIQGVLNFLQEHWKPSFKFSQVKCTRFA